jgi:hypothetical protein
MRAKQLFYVSASILLLIAAYSLGAGKAEGQLPNPIVAASFVLSTASGNPVDVLAFTGSGDVYKTSVTIAGPPTMTPSVYLGNIFNGGTVQTQSDTWGGVKQQYKR